MNDRIRPDLRAMTADPDDLRRYIDDVVPGMSPDDVLDVETLAERLSRGSLRAWWAVIGDDVVGWCALAPGHGKYLPGAWHLYGVWVDPNHRRRGIARAMWEYRIALVPKGLPITVSVQADKSASMALARDLGFREIGIAPPWTTFAREAL